MKIAIPTQQIGGFAQGRSVLGMLTHGIVITPSTQRTTYWADAVTPDMTLTAHNLQARVGKLRTSDGNVAVLVNKFDGVDLPESACLLLVVDGVPDVRSMLDMGLHFNATLVIVHTFSSARRGRYGPDGMRVMIAAQIDILLDRASSIAHSIKDRLTEHAQIF